MGSLPSVVPENSLAGGNQQNNHPGLPPDGAMNAAGLLAIFLISLIENDHVPSQARDRRKENSENGVFAGLHFLAWPGPSLRQNSRMPNFIISTTKVRFSSCCNADDIDIDMLDAF